MWRSERLLLFALVLLNIFFARRTFQSGIWADNDSVCHYAYLRHLVEEVYPATGSFLGYSPKFNMGVPFLLYNTPPGLYMLSALVSAVLPISALAGLKVCVFAGFLSVPLLGYAIARTFEDAPEDAPKFVAILLSLYSSELYGLEFFFKNGMLNPALGVPFMLATLYFFRRAETTELPRGLRHIAFAAFFFACTVCTHVLSAYMLCLALGAFVLGRPTKCWGHDILRLVVVLVTGGALAAFWIVPSAPFAAAEDAAYTWLRRPEDVISSFIDGSLLSSYFAGFFPRFIAISYVGGVAVALGALGLVIGFRRRHSGPRSAFYVFVFGFLIMLGPAWSFGVRYLPGYDRLLWYRFLTIVQIGWLILAGFGAAYLAHAGRRFIPYNRLALAFGLGWALLVMTERATKIQTTSDYPEFTEDADHIAGWLREHGDRRGRVYDEFLWQGIVQPPSVNYIRHMMPILADFDEIGGWIYENNVAGQALMKKGVFWHSPFPIVDGAPTYNVKYIVAGSSHLIRALSFDPRWKDVVKTQHLVLFENVAYEPALAEGHGLEGSASSRRYLRGGGYEYIIDLDHAPARTGPLVVKVGYLPNFRVYADDDPTPLATRPSKDGLLQIELPQGETLRRLRCVWDISELRAKGDRISLAGLALTIVLVGLSFLRRRPAASLARPLGAVGLGVAAVGLAGIVIHSRDVDLSAVGFGVRNGIEAFASPNVLKVGSYDDDRRGALVHILPGAWGERSTLGREPSRTLARPAVPALRLALARRAPGTLVLHGVPDTAAITLTLEAPGGAASCTVEGVMNQPIRLPPECAADDGAGELPGVTRDIRVGAREHLEVTAVAAETGITVVEAESLKNVVNDSGYEAFYGLGTVDGPPSNGLVMEASTRYERPVELEGEVPMSRGRVAVWILSRTFHPRFQTTRAELSVWIDGESVGAWQGAPRRPHTYWEHETVFEWIPLGEADVTDLVNIKLRIAKLKGTVAGLADVDALAFVPM